MGGPSAYMVPRCKIIPYLSRTCSVIQRGCDSKKKMSQVNQKENVPIKYPVITGGNGNEKGDLKHERKK